MNKYKRLLQDILVFGLGNFAAKLIQFLLMPLYTNYLTTEIYGTAELINNLSELLYPLITLCIFEAVFRFTVDEEENKTVYFSIGNRYLIRSLCITLPLTIILYLSMRNIYIILLFFVLYSYSFRMFLAFYAKGLGQTKSFSISGIVNAVSLALFSVLFIVCLKMEAGGYLLAIGASYITSALFLLLVCGFYKDINWKEKDKKKNKEMLQYSLPLILYNEINWLMLMSGRYVLSFFSELSVVGLYMAVNKIAAIINMFQQVFYYAFQLNNSRESMKQDTHYFTNVFNIYSSCMVAGSSLIFMILPFMVSFLLKKGFIAGKIYLPFIMYVATIDCIFCFFKSFYTAYKDTKRTMLCTLLGVILNLIFLGILVPVIYIWGVIISLFIATTVTILYRVLDTRRYIIVRANWKLLILELILLFVQAGCITLYSKKGYLAAALLFITIIIMAFIQSKKVINYVLRRRINYGV